MRRIAVEIRVNCTKEHCDNCTYDNGRYLEDKQGKITMWCMRFIQQLQPIETLVENGVKNNWLRCQQCLDAEIKGEI